MSSGTGSDEEPNGLDAQQYAALVEMGVDAVRAETLQAFLDRTSLRVRQTLGAVTVQVLELQPGRECLLPRAVARPGGDVTKLGPVRTAEWEQQTRSNPRSVACRIGDEEAQYGYLTVSVEKGALEKRAANFVYAVARIVAGAVGRYNAVQRLALERGVAQILSDAGDLDEAAHRMLRVFERHIDGHIAELWVPDESGDRLHCVMFLSREPADRTEELRRYFDARTFRRGEGLAGTVWNSGTAIWTSPIAPRHLARLEEARTLGFQCGFGIPISSGGERLGVLTVFAKKMNVPDDPLLRTMEHIGRSIGDFIRRKRAEEDRARAEKAVREKEESFRTLAESIPHMVWTAGPDGFPDYFNQRTLEFVGRSIGEMTRDGVSWADAVHPEDRPRADEAWRRALEETTEYRVDVRLRRASDGAHLWHAIHAVPVQDAQGRITRWFGTATDIDERRKAEAEAERLAAIVEQSEDAILSSDLAGVILSWNRGAERLYGYSTEEAVHQSLRLIVAPDRSHEVMRILRRLGRGQRVDNVETVGRRKDGSPVHVSVTVSPVHDEAGRLVAASAVVRDISERKRAEEALREIDRQKDQFLAMLGHELRNPLAAIRSAAELVALAQPGDSDLETARGVLDRQALHMARLVDGLLDVSRIARGKLRVDAAPLDLVLLTRELVADRGARIREAGLELVLTLPGEELWVSGDRVRLVQVLDNLLTNAMNFTPEQGRIELSLRAEDGEVVARVRDTGVGIPPEMQATIFEPFQQAPHVLARSTGGLGLGLALVKGIVDLHHGTVEAHSEGIDRGTEVVVRLPHASPPRERAAPPPEESTPLRLLLVEDNDDAAQVLSAVLSRDGHQVSRAARGDEALERMRAEHPDVVLCDLGLPGMSGFEVARQARSDESIRDIPLVALTGYGRTEDRVHTSEAGFDDHVTKPASLRDLRESLQRVRPRA